MSRIFSRTAPAPPDHRCPDDVRDHYKEVVRQGIPWAYGCFAGPDNIVYNTPGYEPSWWEIGNGEYAMPVFYCPWCGEKLP